MKCIKQSAKNRFLCFVDSVGTKTFFVGPDGENGRAAFHLCLEKRSTHMHTSVFILLSLIS